MSGFDLLTFLQKALGGLNIYGLEARAVTWINEKGAEYPDLKERADALAAWLQTTIGELGENVDPATMTNTLKGIAIDVIRGMTGVDHDAWGGMG